MEKKLEIDYFIMDSLPMTIHEMMRNTGSEVIKELFMTIMRLKGRVMLLFFCSIRISPIQSVLLRGMSVYFFI